MNEPISYSWTAQEQRHTMDFVHVAAGSYPFGDRDSLIEIPRGFYIATSPVTQAFWLHVMDSPNPAVNRTSDEHPVENVSWDELISPGGFLDRINARPILSGFGSRFRLPTEAEWEYAARGGPHWRDGFDFSGSHNIEDVAWYDRRHGDHTQPVKQKAPNQLGIYDMSGNVWEWCQDVHHPNPARVPADGSPYSGPGEERVLRGGCFHNWAIHCTVSKRYAIGGESHDGCIGFRLVWD